MLARQTHNGGVEWAAEAALAGADQKQVHLVPTRSGHERRRAGRARGCARNIGDHRGHLVRKGTGGFGRMLRAPQLRGRDHLHGLGDLLRRLGGGDTDPHVF